MTEVKEVTKATESVMLTAVSGTTTPDEINEFNKSHCDYLEKYNYSEDDFDPEDGQIHTGMTNEEWLENSIYVGGYRYPDKLLKFLFYYDVAEAEACQKNVDFLKGIGSELRCQFLSQLTESNRR